MRLGIGLAKARAGGLQLEEVRVWAEGTRALRLFEHQHRTTAGFPALRE